MKPAVAGARRCPRPPCPPPRVRSGFHFLEGPVWIADPGYLLVSDMGPAAGAEQVQPSTIHRLAPPAAPEVFVAAGGSNGLALTPDGQQIVAATHDNRTVSAFRLSDRTRSVVAADYQGRAFNPHGDGRCRR